MIDIRPTAGADLFVAMQDVAALKRFSIDELAHLREGVVLVADLLSGLLSQPRYMQDGTHIYNAPGDALDMLHDFALSIADSVEDEAQSRTDLSGSEADARRILLARALVERFENPAHLFDKEGF